MHIEEEKNDLVYENRDNPIEVSHVFEEVYSLICPNLYSL